MPQIDRHIPTDGIRHRSRYFDPLRMVPTQYYERAHMAINSDKPQRWNADVATSVAQFNGWFMRFAPEVFQATRLEATRKVLAAIEATGDLRNLSAATLRAHPEVTPTLRMCTAPPLAVDRLVGLAGVGRTLVGRLEEGRLPTRISADQLETQLTKICETIRVLLDRDLFPWIEAGEVPTEAQRGRAATIVADRLCASMANPIVRNAQETRQLSLVAEFLESHGYRRAAVNPSRVLTDMEAGTYAFRMNVVVGDSLQVNIPVDVVIQPRVPRPDRLPILVEAKSAGDYTNTNKRRKEEATKARQLREAYGPTVVFVLFLCGYFGPDYLGYEAAEGIDWVWEHRIEDLLLLGL